MPGSDVPDALEAALDELYGVEPSEFVTTRKRLASELRAAGEKDAAKVLVAARRPTTAAWALNQLSRHDSGRVEELLARSRDVEAGQAGELDGGRDALRDATRAQREALADATDAAVAHLGERATEAFRAQMRATLQAASADEGVAAELTAGRIVREVSGATGFPDLPGLTLVPDLTLAPDLEEPVDRPSPRPVSKQAPERTTKPATKSAPTRAAGGVVDTLGAKREQAAAERAARAERERLERERVAAEANQRRRDEAEAAARVAGEQADEAEAAAAALQQRVSELERELTDARREARESRDAADRARRAATKLARHLPR